ISFLKRCDRSGKVRRGPRGYSVFDRSGYRPREENASNQNPRASLSTVSRDRNTLPRATVARGNPKPYQDGRSIVPKSPMANLTAAQTSAMRQILLSTAKILISAALLYLALRKVDI